MLGKGFDFCIARHPFLLPHVLAIKGKMGIVADNPGNKPLGVPFFEFLEREVGADNRGFCAISRGVYQVVDEEVKNGERNSVPRSSRSTVSQSSRVRVVSSETASRLKCSCSREDRILWTESYTTP